MHTLFSPIRVGHIRLKNRLALQALPSGFALHEGFVSADCAGGYLRRAQSGVGLVIFEPTYVLPPRDQLAPHLGLYADAHVPGFRQCIDALHMAGSYTTESCKERCTGGRKCNQIPGTGAHVVLSSH